ncbi:MAG: GNAT family N-acetyltransferase [Bacteroidaceae bacterium]|nr:GNAT family N-acetyltransferase [Bacteroidaceae bacterium]
MDLSFEEINSRHVLYSFVEDLLHQAFPENERRDDEMQRHNTDNHPLFHCCLIRDEEVSSPIGLLTYWDFSHYLYIEHLAVSPDLQGKGYGKRLLTEFIHDKKRPIVLEVEHPNGLLSRKRISFYQRCGLQLWECDYLQPPYRPKDLPIPLYLMATNELVFNRDYSDICQTIHRVVYGI